MAASQGAAVPDLRASVPHPYPQKTFLQAGGTTAAPAPPFPEVSASSGASCLLKGHFSRGFLTGM